MLGSNEVSVYRDAQLGWILCSQSEFIGSLLDLRAPASSTHGCPSKPEVC